MVSVPYLLAIFIIVLGSENKTGIDLVLIVLIKKIDNEYVITGSVRCNILGHTLQR